MEKPHEAKLTAYFGPMKSGKSGFIIDRIDTYKIKGMTPIVIIPSIDTRSNSKIVTRMNGGAEIDAISIGKEDNIYNVIEAILKDGQIHVIIADESQFLTEDHVLQLIRVVDELNIPVITVGLKSDFTGKAFPTSAMLWCLANKVEEIKGICKCGRKAYLNARMVNGKKVTEGETIQIGDAEYETFCRICYKEA